MGTNVGRRVAALQAGWAAGRTVVLDGATGTELQRRGVKTELPLWSAGALLSHPDLVKGVHAEYLRAGADIITTNTFRTGSRPVRKAELSISSAQLTKIACELAHQAREETGCLERLIAGCIATLEDCYEPDLTPSDAELREEHGELVDYLVSGGVDFIFAETMNTIRESVIVLGAAQKAGIPAAISFVCDATGNLLSGESLAAALQTVSSFDPLFVGANCAPPERLSSAVDILISETTLPTCVYANGMGSPGGPLGWVFGELGSEAAQYAEHAKGWIERGVKVVGGCCGTTPEYIATLSSLVR